MMAAMNLIIKCLNVLEAIIEVVVSYIFAVNVHVNSHVAMRYGEI